MDRKALIKAIATILSEGEGVPIIVDGMEQKQEPITFPITNHRIDDFMYNPNSSSKRGSKFTPNKKKRKK